MTQGRHKPAAPAGLLPESLPRPLLLAGLLLLPVDVRDRRGRHSGGEDVVLGRRVLEAIGQRVAPLLHQPASGDVHAVQRDLACAGQKKAHKKEIAVEKRRMRERQTHR